MSTSKFVPILPFPMQLGECPVWHPAQAALYWIDIAARAVHRLQPASNEHRYWSLPAEPGCIAYTDGPELVVAMRDRVSLLDTRTGRLEPYLQVPYDPALGRFNDGRCDAKGRLWLGSLYDPRDRPGGTLYCLERGVLRDLRKPVTVSNGIAFNSDATVLYHADTTAHRITAYAFNLAAGTIDQGTVFQTFSSDKTQAYGGRPDGAAVDAEDAYWCAMYEGGRLLRIGPDGRVLQEVLLPVRCPTMMAFGGKDLRTLYITSARHNRPQEELDRFPLSGHVLAMKTDVPGRAEHAYRR